MQMMSQWTSTVRNFPTPADLTCLSRRCDTDFSDSTAHFEAELWFRPPPVSQRGTGHTIVHPDNSSVQRKSQIFALSQESCSAGVRFKAPATSYVAKAARHRSCYGAPGYGGTTCELKLRVYRSYWQRLY
jgi:hypothetical protein